MESYEISATIKFTLDQHAIQHILSSLRDEYIVSWFKSFGIIGEPLAEDECKHFALGGTLRFYGKDGMVDYDLTHEKFLIGIYIYLEKDLPKEIVYGKGIDNGLTDEFVVNDIVQYALFGHLFREGEERNE